MSMQKRIYDYDLKRSGKESVGYSDAIADYGLQVEAWWLNLRERVGRRMGKKSTGNVLYVDFPQQSTTPEPLTLDVGEGS